MHSSPSSSLPNASQWRLSNTVQAPTAPNRGFSSYLLPRVVSSPISPPPPPAYPHHHHHHQGLHDSSHNGKEDDPVAWTTDAAPPPPLAAAAGSGHHHQQRTGTAPTSLRGNLSSGSGGTNRQRASASLFTPSPPPSATPMMSRGESREKVRAKGGTPMVPVVSTPFPPSSTTAVLPVSSEVLISRALHAGGTSSSSTTIAHHVQSSSLRRAVSHLYQAITLFVSVSRESHEDIGSVPSLLLELYSLVAEDSKILTEPSSSHKQNNNRSSSNGGLPQVNRDGHSFDPVSVFDKVQHQFAVPHPHSSIAAAAPREVDPLLDDTDEAEQPVEMADDALFEQSDRSRSNSAKKRAHHTMHATNSTAHNPPSMIRGDILLLTQLRHTQKELRQVSNHHHIAAQQIDVYKQRMKENVKEVSRLDQQLEVADRLENDLRTHIHELEAKLRKKDFDVNDLKAELVSIRSTIKDSHLSDQQRLAERTADLRNELVGLYDTIRQNDEMTKSYEREIEMLQSDLHKLEERHEDLQVAYRETQVLLGGRDDEIYNVRIALVEKDKEIQRLEGVISAMQLVAGSTMLQAQMISSSNGQWSQFKQIYAAQRATYKRDVAAHSSLETSTMKVMKAFRAPAPGAINDRRVVPSWLASEGRIRCRPLSRPDVVHIALQSLAELMVAPQSLPPFSLHRRSIGDSSPLGQADALSMSEFHSVSKAARQLAARLPFAERFKPWLMQTVSSAPGSKDASPSPTASAASPSAGGGGGSAALGAAVSSLIGGGANEKLVVELCYGVYCGLVQWAEHNADLYLFSKIIRGDLPPEIVYHVYDSIDSLQHRFVRADCEFHGGEARGSLPITAAQAVLKDFLSEPYLQGTAEEYAKLLFLLTMDYNVPYVPYPQLFVVDDDGDRCPLIAEAMILLIKRAELYYDEVQDLIMGLAAVSLLPDFASKRTEAELRVTMESPLLEDDYEQSVELASNFAEEDSGAESDNENELVAGKGKLIRSSSRLSQRAGTQGGDAQPEFSTTSKSLPKILKQAVRDGKPAMVALSDVAKLWVLMDPARSDDIEDIMELVMQALADRQVKQERAANPLPPPPEKEGRNSNRRSVAPSSSNVSSSPAGTGRKQSTVADPYLLLVKQAQQADEERTRQILQDPHHRFPAMELIRMLRKVLITRQSVPKPPLPPDDLSSSNGNPLASPPPPAAPTIIDVLSDMVPEEVELALPNCKKRLEQISTASTVRSMAKSFSLSHFLEQSRITIGSDNPFISVDSFAVEPSRFLATVSKADANNNNNNSAGRTPLCASLTQLLARSDQTKNTRSDSMRSDGGHRQYVQTLITMARRPPASMNFPVAMRSRLLRHVNVA